METYPDQGTSISTFLFKIYGKGDNQIVNNDK